MNKKQSLTPAILQIVEHQGTERPGSGCYHLHEQAGTYLCRQCGLALFRSTAKFSSHCGWPSFDEEIDDHIDKRQDKDGRRIEILCKRCEAHLGHVFTGEQYTAKNTRHCVNSLALDFVADTTVTDTEEAIVAAGCFWGVEYYFKKCPGVLKVEVGYTGGALAHPSYEQVCTGQTGHVEAIRVIYDKAKTDYGQIIRYFFEIHDPTQANGQGPDIGPQYLSVIYYYDEYQQKTADALKKQLQQKMANIVTAIKPVQPFWPAEEYHQDYYHKTGHSPYCHHYVRRF